MTCLSSWSAFLLKNRPPPLFKIGFLEQRIVVYFICHWGQILWSSPYSVLESLIFSVYITSWVVSFICISLNITYILMTPKYNFLAWPSPLNFSPVYLWLPTQHLGYQIDIWKLTCLLTYLSKSTLSIPLNDISIFLVR